MPEWKRTPQRGMLAENNESIFHFPLPLLTAEKTTPPQNRVGVNSR
jgi:hypothetical protein